MLRDGQKWACDSCIRGHRVSNCNHHDRDLKLIAPKGRPVKQCEHCRSARKDKSHHAKCDCGNKKQKDVPESEPKVENASCCCHKGGDCVCGINSEMSDMRQETILRRRTMPVKSKPVLSTSNSDSSLTVLNGHKHKPVHNTHGQALKTPYPKPARSTRPNSIHNPQYARNSADSLDAGLGVSRSVDDMSLLSSSNKIYGTNFAAQLSVDSIQGYDFGTNDYSYLLGSEDGSVLSRTTSAEALAVSTSWFDSSLTTVTEAPGDFSTSPNGLWNDADSWNIPSATSEYFSPSDLPLVTSQPSELAQTISHPDSNYQSAPPLTASSSGAQSEIGEPSDATTQDAFPPFWSGTVGIRDSYPLSSSISLTNDYGFPQSLPTYDTGLKKKSKLSRHRQTFSSGSSTHHHSHHVSDSTTVPDDLTNNVGVNIGHLQNLATLKSHQDAVSANLSASPEYPPIGESEFGSISIPASLDDAPIRDDWYFLDPSQTGSESRDYAWLLDSA